jgi:hypothetical protein
MSFIYTKFNICMYCRRLIGKCTPHLSRAVPGSNVFLRFCFPLGGIHFALGGVLFSPVSLPFCWALYGLLGSVAKGPRFWLQNIKSAEVNFRCKIDLLWVNFTVGCTSIGLPNLMRLSLKGYCAGRLSMYVMYGTETLGATEPDPHGIPQFLWS